MTSEQRRRNGEWRAQAERRLQILQTRLGELNRRLAEQSVPEIRRATVGRLVLEEKAAIARQNVKRQ